MPDDEHLHERQDRDAGGDEELGDVHRLSGEERGQSDVLPEQECRKCLEHLRGRVLLDNVGDPSLEPVKVTASPVVTHIKYRVVH